MDRKQCQAEQNKGSLGLASCRSSSS